MGCNATKPSHQKVEMLPKLPPLPSQKVAEIGRSGAKDVNDNASEDKIHRGEDQNLVLIETNYTQEVEEYGRFSSVEELLICPRSPSFKFYISSLQDKEDDHCKNDDYMKKWSLSNTHIDDAAEIVETQTSTEESTVTKIRIGTKGMRLRKVIPRGKPVMNFLNVKSCYYPSCGGGHEISRRLIAAKPAT